MQTRTNTRPTTVRTLLMVPWQQKSNESDTRDGTSSRGSEGEQLQPQWMGLPSELQMWVKEDCVQG